MCKESWRWNRLWVSSSEIDKEDVRDQDRQKQNIYDTFSSELSLWNLNSERMKRTYRCY